ncbi:site-specific DNA-methyltransferase [Candidatus Chloroploca sp. M-50]|uniref:Site-specific DNA-methyltransferase n=1 Tax=Candidatus Chloroploca mongolica TaxID=2528176 RepID=A0ABS4DEH5_9CHLR|nr:site-specific DNA-methyltransferase [Candidatus Chloroploca mongolica]MBP1467838.1 site-specific DNA-methyltransferase [Candidatus Chloroploca mongolica]
MPTDDPTDRVEQYAFEPIKGYPMLHWRGKRPFTSTQYYPAQHRETHGPEVNGWRNKIFWGDNLQVMSHLLREFRGKVQLVYIDPPFDSKADYKKTVQLKGKSVSNDQSTFEEKQYSDIWTNDEYLQFMFERIILLRELLSQNGSVYVHCDWRMNSYIRILLDEVFGKECFCAEVKWKRVVSTGSSKAISKKYPVVDDSILFYSKSSSYIWNTQYIDFSEEYILRYNQEDERGRFYWDNLGSYSQETLERLIAENRIKLPLVDNRNPRYKNYLHERKGVVVDNLWTNIVPLNSQAIESLGYPTQKPEALLERIIRASSNPGDLVFDCFMGSGTTQAVAMKLGRRFIGADINLGAVQITTKRLLAVGAELQQPQRKLALDGEESTTLYTGFEVYNVNNYDIFRNPLEAKELLLQALEVNRLQAGGLFDGEKDGRMVKVMPVNRIATRQDLNELITGFDYRAFERRQAEHPTQPVERITLVCMGHEAGLAAHLQKEVSYKLDVEVVDILRDKQNLQFKRDAEARIVVQDGHLVIERFYPMNLLAKLSLQQENVGDWRELVESVMIDWNYDGAVLQPALVDIPERDELVAGRYPIPADAGTIRVKLTDLLSESLEQEVRHG